MDFCPDCKSRLKKRIEEEQTIMECSKCNYTQPLEKNKKTESIEKIKSYPRINDENPIKVLDAPSFGPTVDYKCKKCGYDKAYQGEIRPTFSNDEQSIILYKCVKCGKTERIKTAG